MRIITFTCLALMCSTPALAHHPLDGMPMQTWTHGILSGVGHPILGFDHLFFVALVGIFSVCVRARLSAPLAYLGAMLGGCLFTSLWSTASASELMIALSLLVAGSMLLSGHRFGNITVLLSFAGFGLFHGAAFGTSLAAQEAGFGVPVLLGYLLGLGLTQYVVAVASGRAFVIFCKTTEPGAMPARLAGAMVAGAGLLLVLERVEGPFISLISS
jgi:urease accessory protein